MKRYKIIHQTHYDFPNTVQLLPHTLRLRPREGHELRLESSQLNIVPAATLRWQRDVEGNSVAIATFSNKTRSLKIDSEIIIQQYDLVPQDFLVADYAVNYPFQYSKEEKIQLAPYLNSLNNSENPAMQSWADGIWKLNEKIQTFALLLRLNQQIYQSISYRVREEEGVQEPGQTLALGTGSCRDSASLFMAAARRLGFAARFVSGYVNTNAGMQISGSTHAWAEVFIPGAGWKGFDPTIGNIVGADHVAVAVARLPESVPPVAGNFLGDPGAVLTVKVWVNEIC